MYELNGATTGITSVTGSCSNTGTACTSPETLTTGSMSVSANSFLVGIGAVCPSNGGGTTHNIITQPSTFTNDYGTGQIEYAGHLNPASASSSESFSMTTDSGGTLSCMTELVAQFPTAPTSPSGTITFSSASSGFPSSCAVTAGSCTFNFVPSTGSAGIYDSLKASFAGSTSLTASSGTTSLTVQTTTSITSLICSPSITTVGVSETCTVTVTNGDITYQTSPGGTVAFSGTPSGMPTTCTVTSQTGQTASSCQVTWTPGSNTEGSNSIEDCLWW